MTKADEIRAERVFDLVDPWNRDGETVESTAKTIEEDPKSVIDFLLDILDGYIDN